MASSYLAKYCFVGQTNQIMSHEKKKMAEVRPVMLSALHCGTSVQRALLYSTVEDWNKKLKRSFLAQFFFFFFWRNTLNMLHSSCLGMR